MVVYVDLVSVFSIIALFAGILLVIGGLYARGGGRLRHRGGAAVLAGFFAILGLLMLGASAIMLLRA